MPVPIFSGHEADAADRPSGLVPPVPELAGVTELRVHGVGGTTPGALLGDLAPQQVAGDSVAGFYRTADVRGRHVEAYSWGGLTSRSGFRVLWLLLLPFMLANLAGWMGSPRATRSAVHRWLVRCGALAVTLNLLLVTAMVSVDVLGYQCGSRPDCTDRWWLAPLRWGPAAGHPARLVLLGALLPVALLVVLAFLSYRSRQRYEAVRPPGQGEPGDAPAASAASAPAGLADPRFWDGARATKRLGHAHAAASIGLLTVLVLHCTDRMLDAAGVPARLGGLSAVLQVAALLVLAAAIALLAAEEAADRLGEVLVGGAAAVGALAAVVLWVQPAVAAPPAGQLPGIREVINSTYGLVFVVLLAVLVSVVAHGQVPGSFRWGAPFVVLALAVALLNAVLLGVLIRVAGLAGTVVWQIGGTAGADAGSGPQISVFPVIRAAAPYLTVVPLILLLLFAAYEGVRTWRAGRRGWAAVATEYGSLADPDPEPSPELAVWRSSALAGAARPTGRQARRQWRRCRAWCVRLARARRLAVAGTEVSYLLTAVAVVGVLVLVWAQWRIWLTDRMPPGGPLFLAIGTTLATALPLLLLGALRAGWRSLAGRRRIGVLWDVGTFWPRAFHPLAPPSYAERAVPDLQRRLWWLHDNGGRVLLAAHSQGTVLAAAALLQRDARPEQDRVVLVTFGSPLGKLYRWGFPAYVNDEVLATLVEPGPDRRPVARWTNVHYRTDYIGGPVFAAARPGVDRVRPRVDRVDRELPDPRTSSYLYGQPLPPIGGHSGYWVDPAMWCLVDELAADLS